MKQNILLLISLFLFSALAAQNLEFSDGPIVVEDIASSDFEGVGYSTINNLGSDVRNLTWTRTEVEKTEEWWTAVCDKVQCYAPPVGSRDFVLNANEEGTMDIHAYPNEVEGSAVVEIVITDRDDPSVSISNMYYFNAQPVSTGEVIQQTIKTYPNPSSGLFTVKAGDLLGTVEIFNLTGEQVKSFTYGDGQWYDITDLPSGTYLVRLIDREAKHLVTKLMQKL